MARQPDTTTQNVGRQRAGGLPTGAVVNAEMLQALLPLVPSAALAIDALGKVVACNERAVEMFGYPESQLKGLSVEELMPGRFRSSHLRHREAFAQHPRARPMGTGLDLYALRADGSEFPVDIALVPAQSELGPLVIAAVRDMSERQAAEERMRAQADRLLMAAERERIAADLHDLVIQRLFGAGLRLQGALSLIDDRGAAAKVASTIEDLDTTIKEIRQAIFALEAAPGRGLEARVLEAIAHARDVLGLDVAFSVDAAPETVLSPQVEIELAAVLREALSNCARHAQPKKVEVNLSAGDYLVLQVIDDGVGLGRPKRLSGLSHAAARAERLGGSVELRERDGGGTHLEWRVPLHTPS